MKESRFTPAAMAKVRWLRMDEGGRMELPTGPIYAATAVFVRGDSGNNVSNWAYSPNEHFSIVLKFPEGKASTHQARDVEIDFLARELVKDRLMPGARLLIMEGARPVAEGEVDSVLI